MVRSRRAALLIVMLATFAAVSWFWVVPNFVGAVPAGY